MNETASRFFDLLHGRPVDRAPVYPFLLGYCARRAGQPLSVIYADPDVSFDLQREALAELGFDFGPVYGYAAYGAWEFGGAVNPPLPNGQAPAPGRFPVMSEADLDRLPRPDVAVAGSLPLAMAFSRRQEREGFPITVVTGGVFTTAGNICPAEMLCRWLIRRPDSARRLLDAAADHLHDVLAHWAEAFGPERVIPQFWEPLAANSVISPRAFADFVLPLTLRVARQALGMGYRHLFFHICGDQARNLPFWEQVPMGNPGLVSFGPEIAVSEAVARFGAQAVLIGNLPPAALLAGPESRIRALCRLALTEGAAAPRGFMLSAGCEVSPDTPAAHLHLMRQAAESHALSAALPEQP